MTEERDVKRPAPSSGEVRGQTGKIPIGNTNSEKPS